MISAPPLDGLRLAVGTLTAVPVRVENADRRVAGQAMALAPVVGLGLLAGAVGLAARWWTDSAAVAAVAAVAALAALTRGLHLDGLADTADGLGSSKPAEEALEIMKRSDVGPFGVVTLVLTMAAQIAFLATAYTSGRGFAAVIVAAVVGRLAITVGCTAPIPSARSEGLGAWVAGSVRLRTAVPVGVAAAVACGLLGLVVDAKTAVLCVTGAVVGVAAALFLLNQCIQRFGGITGDVLGALVEVAATAALLVLAFN
jgi:adenosylcobinamide-GDP ribazoletransferase